jgi:hypothetical protein
MRFPESVSQYLAGDAYSNGLDILFELDGADRVYRSRSDVLAGMCAGKDVIHVGCVDHDVSSIVKKQKRNKWLHGVLCASARRCYGVDIEEEGIRYLREELGYTDVAALDIIEQPNETLDTTQWDYLLVPEVLEHVNSPFDFLAGLHGRFSGNVGKLVVTVPNAFARENFRHAVKGVEIINSDHRFWFTPYTLGKLAVLAGYAIDNITMCRHGKVKRRSFIKNRYYSRHPLLRSDIVATLSFQAVTR